ncbi:hypothetical protein CFOL_v3_02378 [Cephalotus follicularis]|uniref:F-box domain-containing protein n=1 Tax=Cephalotus follicularis TaxID=3775 RepID=A0A1Q3AT48_CEPFO|nr:hypothetical protein CFOL_v3_02378 [Cephalotus follicularis]
MALGKRCCSTKSKRSEEQDLGLGFVRYTRGIGRKRIVISSSSNNGGESSPIDSHVSNHLKRQCSERLSISEADDKYSLESLHQDILIKILCGVDHDDLKQLFHVSKTIREATLIAKKWHFAFSTPRKSVCRNSIDLDEQSMYDEIEAPNAPIQRKRACYKSQIDDKNLSDISVALFPSPKKELFVETEI